MLDSKAVLLIIDVQKGMDLEKWGPRSSPKAVINIARILSFWRANDRPIIHIQHNSTEPDSPLQPGLETWQFIEEVEPLPSEKVIGKSTNSAFIDSDLEEYLQTNSIDSLVIVGMTTDHCVSATSRMAGDLNYDTFVITDATACFGQEYQGRSLDAETVHAVSLASLDGEFATLLSTDQLLASLSDLS